MTYIDFCIDIPETEFPKTFQSPEAVQLMMVRAETEQAGYLKALYDHKEDKLRNKDTHEELVDKLAYYEDRIPSLEAALEQATHPQHINETKEKLALAIRGRDRVQKRIKDRDERDLMIERMEHQINRMVAKGFDEWADKLGKWFSTGAVGPGTVTFKDKTYTAQ
jgi:hypothetical protein